VLLIIKWIVVLPYKKEREDLKMGKNSRNGLWQRIFYFTLVLILLCQIANANHKDPNEPNEPNEPKELLSCKWNAVISILQMKDLKQEVKEKKICEILAPIFDFPLMAKLSLGRKHWPKLDEPQREKFTQLYSELLKRAYWKKVALYKDEKLLIKPIVKKKSTCQIPTELLYEDKKVAITYKLRKLEKSWKIYDVEIQGVSVLLTYRSQFDEILSRGTVEDLLAKLEKPPDD
jgi:phospholipid transport system substrate-binding protein